MRVLTLREFKALPTPRQCDEITFHANFLAQRTVGQCSIFLYHTPGGFFIEVFYSSTRKEVVFINPFETTFGLAPYLDMISLEDLEQAS